ncbi:MAG: chemotaxis protein CheB [Proteobacteria bacterium]|nr:chemotaxis protein CheB [Pseudomonadota bacterium]
MESFAYRAVVMGTSAGGMQALKTILPALPESFPLPIAIVQHMQESADDFLAEYLNGISPLTVKEAEDKEPFSPGTVYLAPAGYHLLIEADQTFSLSVDVRENYCCPAIDALFESAAEVFGEALIGVVLTGANGDGSHGLKTIKARGGFAIVQNPVTAESDYMPAAALAATPVDRVGDLEQIASLLVHCSEVSEKNIYG